MVKREQRCPDCSSVIALGAFQMERKRARCAQCALDVRVVVRNVGEGPEREAEYVSLSAAALVPSTRLRLERDASRLTIARDPDATMTVAFVALVGGLLLVVLGVAGALPLIVGAIGFLALLAGGFVTASQPRGGFDVVVERGLIQCNGAVVSIDSLMSAARNAELAAGEVRWVTQVVSDRVEGDRDLRA
jgi:hypothetical protein